MREFLGTSIVQAVISITVLSVLITAGYYVVRRYRDRIDEDEQSASDMMSNFREMRHEGDISDAEYRTIKTVLGAKLQDELKNTGEKG